MSTSTPTEIIGYWFAKSDILPHGDNRKVVIGETLKVEGNIVPCKHGLHASADPFDALQYAPGSLLYKVKLSGTVVAHKGDKHVASERTALAVVDATDMLYLFARKTALSVIHLWDAPQIVRDYLQTGAENIRDSARVAAWAAANAAANYAANYGAQEAIWAAATSAAFRGPLRNTASATARDAASAVASAAVSAAVSAARGAASTAAVSVVVSDTPRKMFNEMVSKLFEKEENQ